MKIIKLADTLVFVKLADTLVFEMLETHRVGDTAFAALAERQLVYNDAGRLFQLYENGTLVGTYTYNAYGQRTRKETVDGIIIYHYSQGQLVSETRADGSSIKDYIRQNGELIAQIDVTGAIDQISYIHTDHLSTPRLATDSDETIVWKWEGEAFGKELAQSSGIDVNIRFPGQYFDFESGLFYNYFRYYDPQTGRYITSDPIGLEGGLNTYAYVGGNPTGSIDPSGLDVISANISVRVPSWLTGGTGQGGSLGVAVSLPGPNGGNFDVGVFAEGNGGGDDYGTGRATVGLGYDAGSVQSLTGEGGTISFNDGIGGLSLSFDGNDNLTGGGLHLGPGYNIGGSGTKTVSYSARDLVNDITGFFNDDEICP